MSEAIVGHLVWLKAALPNAKLGRARMIAEKWPFVPIEATKNGKTVLAKHPLTADGWALKLAILEQRYPAPQMVEDNP